MPNRSPSFAPNRPGLPLGVYSADCAPVLLHDPVKGVIAAIHSGWRGTAKAVVRVAVQTMGETFGSLPVDLVAAVGPTIGGCCYEVGPEVVQAMESALAAAGAAATPQFIRPEGDKHLVDLPGILSQQLLAAGLMAPQIHLSGVCTFCKGDLCFSYRRQGAQSGRMLAIIAL